MGGCIDDAAAHVGVRLPGEGCGHAASGIPGKGLWQGSRRRKLLDYFELCGNRVELIRINPARIVRGVVHRPLPVAPEICTDRRTLGQYRCKKLRIKAL